MTTTEPDPPAPALTRRPIEVPCDRCSTVGPVYLTHRPGELLCQPCAVAAEADRRSQ